MKVLLPVIMLALLLTACASCSNDENIYDNNGVVISRPYLWTVPLTDDENSLIDVSISAPLNYADQNIIVPAWKNKHRSLLSLNAETGKVNWQWDDLLSLITDPSIKDFIYLRPNAFYLEQNLLFFAYSTSSYCIDVNTGQTAWKHKFRIARRGLEAGIGDTYFTAGLNYDRDDPEKIYKGQLSSPDIEQLFLLPDYTYLPKMVAFGYITAIRPFKRDGILYVAFSIENPYSEFTPAGWGLTELNLYNLSENKYVYKKVAINLNRDTRSAFSMTYAAPNLYFESTKYIHSYNAMTGEENWRTYLGSAPLLSALLLADNKLFAACEDDNYLFCLDASTGRILWQVHNTGTCSPLSYLNGVLYFLGGGDGYLHAVEAATGKLLWKIKSPDEAINSNAFFYGSVNAVPGKNGSKGVVVATSGLNAYAYEAIR